MATAPARPRIGGVRARRRELLKMGRVGTAMAALSADGFIFADPEGRITGWSPGAENIFGQPRDRMLGEAIERILPECSSRAIEAGLAAIGGGDTREAPGQVIETRARRPDGQERAIEMTLSPVSQRSEGLAVVVRDIQARKTMEADFARERALLAAVVDNVPAFLFVKDADTLAYKLVNRFGQTLFGLDPSEVIGRTDKDFLDRAEVIEGLEKRDREALASTGIVISESTATNALGGARQLRTRRLAVRDAEGRPQLLIGITEDITELRAAEERGAYLARHDALTGLLNRTALTRAIGEALAAGATPSILSIDLDRFKAVNDFFGHAAGDELLQAAAAALTGCAQPGDLVARLGGDEFALVHMSGDPAAADQLSRRVVAALARPFLLERCVANIGASIGIAVAPADGDTAAELLRNADLALQRARGGGCSGVSYFEPAMDASARERRELEAELRSAIASGAIVPHFQPIMAIASGEVESFEALARWHHAEQGNIPPDRFIPVAEETGLILPLGLAMLEQVMIEAASWDKPLQVNVNVSPAQIADAGFVPALERLLARTALAPGRLGLEITESLLIGDAAQALERLRAIQALGVRIIMDDFGTGYSSLRYFQIFPFDKIKIDRGFVNDMETSRAAMAVVQAAVGLAQGLGLPVVAEGVETELQLAHLESRGCTHAQGWLIGRPQPIAKWRELVRFAPPPLIRAA